MRQAMAHRDPLSPTPMPTILGYGIAVLSVAIAVVLDFFVLRQFEAVLTPFLFAVAATVWYAGTGPGVLAIVLSLLSLNYFFLPPVFSFSPISYADFVYLAFCTFCALAVGWVSTVRRRTEQELRLAREELEATVAERTASLRRSEAYLAEAQRLSHCGVTAYKGMTVFYGSEEIYRIWGFDPAQGVPSRKAVLQRIHPDDRDRLNAEVERALGEKKRYSAAYRIVLPDGTVKHLESIGQPVFSTNGELVEVVATQIDVTERKHAEEALRESEAKIRRLVDSNIIGIFVWDFDGRILEANDEFLRMVSYDREDLVSGRVRWADLTPPDWRDRNNARIEQQKRSGRFEPFEKEFTRKDGSRVPILIGGATFEEGGNQGVAFVLDLTERKRAEKTLREREAQLAEARRELRQMIDTIPIPVASYSADARRDFVNAAWKQYTGLSDEAALGTEWSAVAHPYDVAIGEKTWRDALATGEPWHTEERVRRADGQYRWFAIDRVTARDENGKIIKWYGTAYDIEDRKRAEERLRVQHTVAQILAEAATIEEATPRILLAMGDCLGWDVGVLWRVDREAEALRCVELWHKASIAVPEFERVSREFTFGPGFGLPGRVWSSLEPEYIPDVAPDENFPRAPIAEQEGLRAAFGFPILLGKEVLGVIEFFSREIRQPDQELLNVLATIGSQIGQFIERKRAEQALRRSEAYLAEAQRLSHCGVTAYKGSTVFYGSEEIYRIWGFDPAQGVPSRKAVLQRIHPDDRDRLNAEVERALSEKKRYSTAYRIVLPDGTIKHLESIGQPVFSTNGELVEVVATQIDVTERRCAEEALRESEAKIRRLVDSNIIGIFVWDFDGRILEANNEFLRMVSYDREDLVSGRVRWADLTPPDWRDRNNARIEQQKGGARFEPFEKEFTRKDGSRVPILIGGATFEEGGNQGVAFVLDLTERKRVEDALREREVQLADARRELRQMIDTIPIPVASYSADARRDFVNAAWKQYTGLSDEAALGTEWSAVAHPDDVAIGEKMWRDALATGEPWHTEERVRRADGQYRWFAIDRVAARDENGKIIKWYGTAYDIEDRKRAEDALRESEYKLRQIIETVPSHLWSADPDFEPTRLNQRLLNYFGMRPEDFKEGGWLALIHPDDVPETERTFSHAIQTGSSYQGVLRFRRADGAYRWHEGRGEPLRDREGRIIQWYGLSVDIDEAKKAEDRLRRSESYLAEAQLELAHANRVATLGQLTASITHEVNQPITAAVTYALAARRF